MIRSMSKLCAAFLLVAGVAVAQNPSSGVRFATDYGQWTIPQGSSPAFGAIQWSTASLCTPISQGNTIYPIQVGRKIKIVDADPTKTETVTITAARTTGPSCTLNAVMQYQHTTYTITSGTAGLQEAIDAGRVAGVAVVIVTPGWVALGGQESQILGAIGSSAVPILDYRTAPTNSYGWNGSGYTAFGNTVDGVARGLANTAQASAQAAAASSAAILADRGSFAERIMAIANSDIKGNHALFNDGADYWKAGPAYGMYLGDTGFAMLSYPSYFTAAQNLSAVQHFLAARSGAGDIPFSVNQDGTAANFYSAYDFHHAHVSIDSVFMAVALEYEYYRKSGDITAFAADAPIIKAALARVVRNPTTHLVTVNAGDEYVPFAFQEYMRFTGDNATASVFLARASQLMGLMYLAAGDSVNAATFNADYTVITQAIQANMIDSSTGLLWASLGQNKQDDILASSLFTYYEQGTSAQESAIAANFNANFSTYTLFGNVWQSPLPWALVGSIPAGGGSPYGSSPYNGSQYEGGYLNLHAGWFAYALAKANPAQVQTFLAQVVQSPDPTIEFVNRDGSFGGTTPNLESPMGPLDAATKFPGPLTISQTPINTVCVLGRYGQCVLGYPGQISTTVTTSQNVLSLLAPQMAAGTIATLALGKQQSNGHAVYLGHVEGATATPYNYDFIQSYNSANPLQYGASQHWFNGGPMYLGNGQTGGTSIPTCAGLFNVGLSCQMQVASNGFITAPVLAFSTGTFTGVAGTGAGTSPTAVATGSPQGFSLAITPGATPAANAAIITLSFGGTLPQAMHYTCSGGNFASIGMPVGTSAATTTSVTLAVGATPLVAGTSYVFNCTGF